MHIKSRAVAIAAAVAIGGGTGAALAATSGDGTPAPWPSERTDVPVPATAAQKAAFATLGAVPGAGDPDRALLRALAERSRIGLDADGARVVGTGDRGPVWLAPASGGLCLAAEDTEDGSIGIACEPDGDVLARGTTVGDGTAIYGVVPDGTEEVTVTPAGGEPRPVDVSQDGFYVLPSEDATVALHGQDGDRSFGVGG